MFVEVVHQLHAAADKHPGVDHALVETERQRSAECEGGVFAHIIIGSGLTHLDASACDGIRRLQARNDFTGSKNLNLKFVVRRFRHRLGEYFGSE